MPSHWASIGSSTPGTLAGRLQAGEWRANSGALSCEVMPASTLSQSRRIRNIATLNGLSSRCAGKSSFRVIVGGKVAIQSHRILRAILESWSRASVIDFQIHMSHSAWARNATGSLPHGSIEGAELPFSR